MAVTYTCDRCSVVLDMRDDRPTHVGAHRLKIKDVIPWLEHASYGTAHPSREQVDLCNRCTAALNAWFKTPPAAEESGARHA